mgnify:CR=1 FL=1
MIETECGFCGKPIKVQSMDEIGIDGCAICDDCKKLVEREIAEWEKYGFTVKRLKGGKILVKP